MQRNTNVSFLCFFFSVFNEFSLWLSNYSEENEITRTLIVFCIQPEIDNRGNRMQRRKIPRVFWEQLKLKSIQMKKLDE